MKKLMTLFFVAFIGIALPASVAFAADEPGKPKPEEEAEPDCE